MWRTLREHRAEAKGSGGCRVTGWMSKSVYAKPRDHTTSIVRVAS